MTTPLSPTPGETLRKAAEIMSERGHCKGALENGAGEVCANGAIILALKEEDGVARATMGHVFDKEYDAFKRAADALARSLSTGWSRFRIAAWNDLPTTSGEDVILALKRAAEDA